MTKTHNTFDNLKGVDGLLIFLNHPLREPKFDTNQAMLDKAYKRLWQEAYDEIHKTDVYTLKDFYAPISIIKKHKPILDDLDANSTLREVVHRVNHLAHILKESDVL